MRPWTADAKQYAKREKGARHVVGPLLIIGEDHGY